MSLADLPNSMLAALRTHGCVEIRRVLPGEAILPGETLEVCASHHSAHSAIAWKPVESTKPSIIHKTKRTKKCR